MNEIPTEQRNAVLRFFSFNAEKVKYSLNHYHWQQEDVSTVINQLLQQYSIDGVDMPYTMEQFKKDFIMAHLGELEPEIRLKGLDPEIIEAYLKKLKKRKTN